MAACCHYRHSHKPKQRLQRVFIRATVCTSSKAGCSNLRRSPADERLAANTVRSETSHLATISPPTAQGGREAQRTAAIRSSIGLGETIGMCTCELWKLREATRLNLRPDRHPVIRDLEGIRAHELARHDVAPEEPTESEQRESESEHGTQTLLETPWKLPLQDEPA